MTHNIHPTAIVDSSARLAQDAVIGPYAVIGPGTDIGARTWVGPHAVIEYAKIGSDCKIHPHAFIGTPPQDLKFGGEETHVEIGDKTVIRECVTVNRGTKASGKTVVGENCLLMAYVHVAHDCRLGNGVIMANLATLAGHVSVADDVVMGGFVAIHQFTRVGTGAMLGGGSKIPVDVPPYCMTHGDRATLVGLNLVGLKRKGLARNQIAAIKTAYKTIFLSQQPLKDTLTQLEQGGPLTTEVSTMVNFLRSCQRGFLRPLPKQPVGAQQDPPASS